MEYVKDRELFSNPYIIQMDRFAESLKHLSETFLYLEDYKGSFTAFRPARWSARFCVRQKSLARN